jgi:hypothetical protein
MTLKTRHRFGAAVGEVCGWRSGANACLLNYSDPVHYNDDDHPFTPGRDADWCVWENQNSDGECVQTASALVHNRAVAYAEPDVTMVMQVPPTDTVVMGDGEPVAGWRAWGVQEQPVIDKAVAGDPDLSDWSAHGGASVGEATERLEAFSGESPEPVHRQFGEPWAAKAAAERVELGALAAELLRTDGRVAMGPWPVRQYLEGLGNLTAECEALEVVKALVVTGDPFLLESWWTAEGRKAYRVQWGTLVGVFGQELLSAVESWPTGA